MSVLALVYITFIGSMLIANDMALLTFLPLGFYTLDTCGKQKYMAFTFIMQNIAANLGRNAHAVRQSAEPVFIHEI